MPKKKKRTQPKNNPKKRLSAEQRIALLLDEDSFVELDKEVLLQSHNFNLQEKKTERDGVLIGHGTIQKRKVCVYAQEFSHMGGSMGEMHNKKIAKIMELALSMGCPIIGLLDSGGARIQEGIQGLDGGGNIFRLNTQSSGVIPQISAILGPCAGIAVYSPALTDIICMVENVSNMFITGPDVIKTVTGETVDFEGLGGPSIHGTKSGVAHLISKTEKECIGKIKKLLSYLPSNNIDNPPEIIGNDTTKRKNKSLKSIVPKDSSKPYDVREVINEVLDKGSFFEIMEEYAQNAVTGLARLNNKVVGLVANQPMVLAGCLDINSSDKISRFVRWMDTMNIPLINFVDVSGYLPGTDQEHKGVIRHGAKMLYAYAEASVPKISVIMRKAYGGAYIALASKELGYDQVMAWPQAEIAVMGAEQAVNIVHRKELKNDPKQAKRKQYVKEYKQQFLNPHDAAQSGKIDLIIDPKDTRKILAKSLALLSSKRIVSPSRPLKKHGNIPL